MTVSLEEREQIKLKGYADIGGLKKNRYWTPDGREIIAVPSIRTYNKIKDGKIIESGTRDANLDKGWLTQKPTNPKHYCPHCDRWHDTKKQIEVCGTAKQAVTRKFEKIAQEEKKKEGSEEDSLKLEVAALKSEMSEIKDMLRQLLKKG